MDHSRITALLQPFLQDQSLSPTQLDQISTYIDLLMHWNARINLTAIRDPEQIVTRHFGESFFLARHVFPPSSAADRSKLVVDIGSGAGFPAMPIKIWASGIHLTLIESNHKKAAFLREVARAIKSTGVNVINERAETLAAPLPQADLVTFRAVENFTQTLHVAVKFLAANARLAILMTEAQLPHLQSLADFSWNTIPIPQSQTRILTMGHIIKE
jgi:16S rRNA (guanine527-N7)-methyltransferase